MAFSYTWKANGPSNSPFPSCFFSYVPELSSSCETNKMELYSANMFNFLQINLHAASIMNMKMDVLVNVQMCGCVTNVVSWIWKFMNTQLFDFKNKIYMLFAGWEVRIVKNCDRGLENAATGRRPRAAFSSPRSQFFTIRTDPKPANNLFIFFLQ